jgi:hypothetical protein
MLTREIDGTYERPYYGMITLDPLRVTFRVMRSLRLRARSRSRRRLARPCGTRGIGRFKKMSFSRASTSGSTCTLGQRGDRPSRPAPPFSYAPSCLGPHWRCHQHSLRWSELRCWWSLSGTVIGPQSPHQTLDLRLELHFALLPACKVGSEPGRDLFRRAVRPLASQTVNARLSPLPFTLPLAGQEMEHRLEAEDIAIQTKPEDDPVGDL